MCAGMSRHIGQHAMLCMDEHLCISQHLLLEALSELHAFLTELSCGKPFLSTDDKILPATQAGNPPFFLVSFQNVSQDTNHCYSKSKACSTKRYNGRKVLVEGTAGKSFASLKELERDGGQVSLGATWAGKCRRGAGEDLPIGSVAMEGETHRGTIPSYWIELFPVTNVLSLCVDHSGSGGAPAGCPQSHFAPGRITPARI